MSNSLAIFDGKSITEQDFYDAIDQVLGDLTQNGDIEQATFVLNKLDVLGDISAKAKARLLYGMQIWWIDSHQEDTFTDYIESISTINRATVVERYIRVEKCINEGYISVELAERPMRDLIPIANAISQGYELDAKTTKKLIMATSLSEIGAILRKVKNKKPRKGGMTIQMERDGTLNVWQDNKKHFVGYLDLREADEVGQKAIERIITSAGVIKK